MSKIPTKVKVVERIPRNAMGKGEKTLFPVSERC